MENMVIYWKYMGNMVIYGCLPSGKRLHNYVCKITMLLMGKSTIPMAISLANC